MKCYWTEEEASAMMVIYLLKERTVYADATQEQTTTRDRVGIVEERKSCVCEVILLVSVEPVGCFGVFRFCE